MTTTVGFDKLTEYLEADENILFALVFGSAAGTVGRKTTTLSDVDVGIYTKNDIPLLEMGRLIVGLEKIAEKKIDLVLLNDLYKKKPNFAFNVVSTARLLFARNKSTFVNFKRNVFLYYLDAKPLIDMFNKSMEKRINAGKFGERNYAG
jgi:predicted nucleotidyltransferase